MHVSQSYSASSSFHICILFLVCLLEQSLWLKLDLIKLAEINAVFEGLYRDLDVNFALLIVSLSLFSFVCLGFPALYQPYCSFFLFPF